jgi:hypothetical protein
VIREGTNVEKEFEMYKTLSLKEWKKEGAPNQGPFYKPPSSST